MKHQIRTARAAAGIARHLRRSGLRRPSLRDASDLLRSTDAREIARVAVRSVVPGVGDEITPALRAAVYEADGHRCRACGSTSDLTVDHVWPTHFGGPTIRANLQTLCRPCNSSKGARLGWSGR